MLATLTVTSPDLTAASKLARDGRVKAVVGCVSPSAVKSTVPKVRARRVASRTSVTLEPPIGAGGVSRLTRAFWFSPDTHQANVLSEGWLVRLAGKSCAVSVTMSVIFAVVCPIRLEVSLPTSGEE